MKRLLKRAATLTPRSVRTAVKERLPTPVVERLEASLGAGGVRAKELETKLWGGFSTRAVRDLTALRRHPDSPPDEISAAARALACWYASHGNYEAAYEEAVWMRVARGGDAPTRVQVAIEADCLMALNRREDARSILTNALVRSPESVHLQLAMANTFARVSAPSEDDDDDARLAWINRSFARHGFARLLKADSGRPLGVRNLRAEPVTCRVPRAEQEKVTVIIPAYAAESTLSIALDSLLAQTWENLEVIVVDDCSPDGTFDVASTYAARDPRVVAVRQPENAGAYPARNEGLRRATGKYVTVHDADDWSHPQKLEMQMTHFMENPKRVANVSYWVRCFEHLYFRCSYFQGEGRPTAKFVDLNTSSLMFRTEAIRRLGGWDEVRAAADTELRLRLEGAYSRNSVARIHSSLPMSFALEIESSLTKSSKTHFHTVSYGVRRDYRMAARYWHRAEGGVVPRLPQRGEKRAFPAPTILLSKNAGPVEVDLLFVMDFAMQGGAFSSTMSYIHAALRAGRRVGVFHWRRYELDVTVPPRSEIRRLVHEGRVALISPDERVSADLVIVGYPVILRDIIDLPPEIECRRFAIITNQMWARLHGGGDVQYDPTEVAANVEKTFGVSPVWVPISGQVRDLMVQDGRYESIHPEVWTPLIDTDVWCEREVSWRGAERQRPVIGRHARDHYTKWPTRTELVRAAYCVDRPCEVRILGGAAVPTKLLGHTPKNWVVHPFDAMEPREFLADLDFFVHYPHEDYIEEFGRAVLEALAAGVPAILPPVFRSTFGEAALYAEPSGVWGLIKDLWSSEQAWLQRVEAGRAFAKETSRWQHIHRRLEGLFPSGRFDDLGTGKVVP